ncbi:MAG: hypothetical protein U9P12_01835 [Verrucomicrobiota bacterium]|nr:hypothetical protein [Verrucomicrobiota bacterium]
MKKTLPPLIAALLLAVPAIAQDEMHTFSNAEGKNLEDRIVKYDFDEKMVTLEENGLVPLDTFSQADQDYILLWNQVKGFKSTMRFKMEVKKGNWAQMKHEQTITPYFMDAIQIPGKKTPNHHVGMLEEYEEYNAVYLEAKGYAITLRNQNFFPIENLVVESKIYYEQENYITPDSLFLTIESEYYETETTNKVKFLSETVPIIIPREEVVLHSECATIIDHQVDRTSLATTSEGEDEDEDSTETTEDFGDWDDHGRRRKGRVNGVWFRIGIKDTNGEMVWREITEPTSIAKKVSWDPEPETEAEEAE